MYWRGYDRRGRPILWVFPGRKDWARLDVRAEIQLHVFLVEVALRWFLLPPELAELAASFAAKTDDASSATAAASGGQDADAAAQAEQGLQGNPHHSHVEDQDEDGEADAAPHGQEEKQQHSAVSDSPLSLDTLTLV